MARSARSAPQHGSRHRRQGIVAAAHGQGRGGLSAKACRAGTDPNLRICLRPQNKHLQLWSPVRRRPRERSSALHHFPIQQPLGNG
eukprot:1157357-Pelagomonas_calceolata.AAC.10